MSANVCANQWPDKLLSEGKPGQVVVTLDDGLVWADPQTLWSVTIVPGRGTSFAVTDIKEYRYDEKEPEHTTVIAANYRDEAVYAALAVYFERKARSTFETALKRDKTKEANNEKNS